MNHPAIAKVFDAGSTKDGQPYFGVAGALYDFACGAAIAGHTDEAFGLLRQSVDEGYMDFDNMQSDRDLSSLHGDLRFGVLLKEVKQRAKDAAAH